MYIREVRWVVYYDKDGRKFKPILQQREGKFGQWSDVPVVGKQKELRWKK